ncbi:MAG: IS4 family transposase [Bacteroidales bacterium]|nr:IS4 family transposase [Bacteroidales bacterium]
MNQGKFIYSQLTDFLPKRIFDGLVNKYQGNKYTKHFTCWNQLLCMIFGQLTGRDSLRDLMVSIEPHAPKYYHLGFGKGSSRSNFANANEKRDYRIFEDYAFYLIEQARKSSIANQDFQLNIDGNVYAFDSTTIDLCLSIFWWAEFRKTKGGIKLHTLYDIKTSIPCFMHVSTASWHDVNALDLLYYEPGGYYILDRGYVDFARLYRINQSLAFFVTRARDNLQYQRMYSNKVRKENGVMLDQIGKLTGFYVSKKYPEKLRRIRFYDEETDNELEFLTNNFVLTSEEIAQLYKYRWKVELFFKWIKQHLKIKSFWGTSLNAVKIQVYSALIAYCLVALVCNKLKIERSTYEILQILSISLLDKTPINELLTNQSYQDVKELYNKQLKINWI